MKIYVARHGETVWNAEHRVQGSTDIELTDKGRDEAYEIQPMISDLDIDFVIASPLKRAFETAEILIDGRLPIMVDDRLTERSWGDNEGKTLDEVDTVNCWNVSMNISDNDIEQIQDFMQRVSDFIEDIKRKYHNRNVLIVSHSAVVRVVHYLLGRIPDDRDLSKIDIPNLRILEYEL